MLCSEYDMATEEMFKFDVKKIGNINSASSLILPEWAKPEVGEEIFVVMNDEYSLSLFSKERYRQEVIGPCQNNAIAIAVQTDMIIGRVTVKEDFTINFAELPAYESFVPETIRLGETPFIIQGNFNHVKLYYGPEAFKKSLLGKRRV